MTTVDQYLIMETSDVMLETSTDVSNVLKRLHIVITKYFISYTESLIKHTVNYTLSQSIVQEAIWQLSSVNINPKGIYSSVLAIFSTIL